jgi:hypothetical protein
MSRKQRVANQHQPANYSGAFAHARSHQSLPLPPSHRSIHNLSKRFPLSNELSVSIFVIFLPIDLCVGSLGRTLHLSQSTNLFDKALLANGLFNEIPAIFLVRINYGVAAGAALGIRLAYYGQHAPGRQEATELMRKLAERMHEIGAWRGGRRWRSGRRHERLGQRLSGSCRSAGAQWML